MDSITQAVLGASMGELVLGRKLGWRGAAWGALLGTLPDLDVIFRPFLNDVEGMYWHRGLSHSLLFVVLATVLIGWLLGRREGWQRHGVTVRRAMVFVFLAYSTHVMIDCFTTYGTSVWAPFSPKREWWNLLFIIDPVFTLSLIGGLLASVIFLRKRPARRAWGNIVGLGLACAYVGFAIVMKTQADAAFKEAVGDRATVVATSPTPLNAVLWRGLVEDETFYYIGYWSPFDSDGEIQFDRIEKQQDLVDPFSGTPELEALKWFSRDVYVAAQAGEDVVFTDMRFGELRLPNEDGEVEMTPMFNWRLHRDEHGNTNFGGFRVDRTTMSLPDTIGRIYRRALGDETNW